MGRPRKSLAPRKPGGRIKQPPKQDERFQTAEARMRHFGVTKEQSISPFAGYLAGVLFLKHRLNAKDLGHYFSFLQIIPRNSAKAIVIRERVQGGRFHMPNVGSGGYYDLVRDMGQHRMNVLNELNNDRLIVPVSQLKQILARVPLTTAGSAFIIQCETQRPTNHRKPRQRNKTR